MRCGSVRRTNSPIYRWARKGSRPRAIHDQRTQSTYLFGAVCPERGAGAALVLPACNTEAMQLHLDEIAAKVTSGAHAVLILDQAGWQNAKDLSSCVRTGCRTASSNPSTTSSTTATTPGHPHRSAVENHVNCQPAIGQSPVTHCEVGITTHKGSRPGHEVYSMGSNEELGARVLANFRGDRAVDATEAQKARPRRGCLPPYLDPCQAPLAATSSSMRVHKLFN
jgi:hypothetical protein